MVTAYIVSDRPREEAETYRAAQPVVGGRGASLTFRAGGVVMVCKADGTATRFEPKGFQR